MYYDNICSNMQQLDWIMSKYAIRSNDPQHVLLVTTKFLPPGPPCLYEDRQYRQIDNMKTKQTSTCQLAGNQMPQLPDKELLMNFCLSIFVLFFWTNVDWVHWCIYAFAGLSRLTNKVFIQLSTSKIRFNTNISSYLNLLWLGGAMWLHWLSYTNQLLTCLFLCNICPAGDTLTFCWETDYSRNEIRSVHASALVPCFFRSAVDMVLTAYTISQHIFAFLEGVGRLIWLIAWYWLID